MSNTVLLPEMLPGVLYKYVGKVRYSCAPKDICCGEYVLCLAQPRDVGDGTSRIFIVDVLTKEGQQPLVYFAREFKTDRSFRTRDLEKWGWEQLT